MLLRLLEVYENDPDSVNGRSKFFNAWSIAYTYNYVVNKKKYNSAEIQARNILLYRWRKDKNTYELDMKQQINNDYVFIGKIIDSIKDDDDFTEKELQIDIKDAPGCVGTVVY